MFTFPKYEALQIEYNVFQRLFDHWEELEKESLPKVQSYLGTDCYINDSNKYICTFTRDSEEESNFFSKAEFNE